MAKKKTPERLPDRRGRKGRKHELLEAFWHDAQGEVNRTRLFRDELAQAASEVQTATGQFPRGLSLAIDRLQVELDYGVESFVGGRP